MKNENGIRHKSQTFVPIQQHLAKQKFLTEKQFHEIPRINIYLFFQLSLASIPFCCCRDVNFTDKFPYCDINSITSSNHMYLFLPDPHLRHWKRKYSWYRMRQTRIVATHSMFRFIERPSTIYKAFTANYFMSHKSPKVKHVNGMQLWIDSFHIFEEYLFNSKV